MTPPRVMRNRSPSQASRGTTFHYTLQYQLLENTQPFGSFKIQFPSFFPNKIHLPKLQLIEASETKSFTITINPDDLFIESMLVQPFVHTIRFPFDPNPPPNLMNASGTNPSNKPHRIPPRRNLNIESYLPEYLQVDFLPLLLPNQKEITITCSPTGYKFFTFTVFIDKPLMDPISIHKFSPLFIHFKSIDNMPDVPYKQSELEKCYAPIYFNCNVNNHDYIIRPQSHNNHLQIDTYIAFFPKIQAEVYFEVHDRDSVLPSLSNSIGTGVIVPHIKSQEEKNIKGLHLDIETLMSPNHTTKASYGFCSFRALPPRKGRIAICPSKEACVVSPGNFYESQAELCIEIIDPIEKFPDFFKEYNAAILAASPCLPNTPIQQKKSDQFHQNLSNFSTPTKGFKLKGLSSAQKKLQNSLNPPNCENNTTRYNRWIFTCDIDDIECSKKIINAINEFNSKMANESNKLILSTLNYSKAIKSSIDLITGFILETTEEKIMVIETRVDEPNEATNILSQITNNLSKNCHFLADKTISFPYPRLYTGFDSLVKLISIPIPVVDLLRIDGLYFHKSINSILFPVIQKLNYLLTCKSIKNAEDCDFFPTEKEMIQLISKGEILTKIPFQKGIPLMTTETNIKSEQRKLKKNCQTHLFKSMINPFISMSSVGAKLLSDFNDPNYQKRLKEADEKRRIQIKREEHKSIFDVESTRKNESKDNHLNGRITSSLKNSKPRFVPSGKLSKTKVLSPRERIGRTDNGDEEIWLVNDPSEVPVEDGWEIEIINDNEISTYRSPSSYRELERLNSYSRNTEQTLDSVRRNKNQNRKSITVKRSQTELMKRKPFKA